MINYGSEKLFTRDMVSAAPLDNRIVFELDDTDDTGSHLNGLLPEIY